MGSWDSVPWMVGGGVKHSTNITRVLAYAAFDGTEGIVGSKDLYVRALAVPAGSVRVAPGACSILCRNPSTRYEAYAARLPVEDVVPIAPTGSASARTDLIIARVKNPWLVGEPFTVPSPQDIAAGTIELVDTYVMSAVAGVTPGQHPTAAQVRAALGNSSAIPLASVALPASTGTVMQTHIRDQRVLSPFNSLTTTRVVNPTATHTITGTNVWKAVAQTTIDIPLWATHVTVAATLGGATVPAGNSNGDLRATLGTIQFEQSAWDHSAPAGTTDRITLMTGKADVVIPTAMRGVASTLALELDRNSGGTMTVDQYTAVGFTVTFNMRPEAV